VYDSRQHSILIFIPSYSESLLSIKNTIDSVVNNDYTNESKIIFLVVDGCIKGSNNDDYTNEYAKSILNVSINCSYDNSFELYMGEYECVKYILLIKKENKGKKDSFIEVQKTLYYTKSNDIIIENIAENEKDEYDFQKYTYINNQVKIHGIHLDKVEYILMLDTDTIIENNGIRILANYLDKNAMTSGVCGITTLTNKNVNLITMSQYYEYWITHYTLKAMESLYGDVLVLSGCFALYRKTVLLNKKLIDSYILEKTDNLYNANITKLGEDRLFTNLLLQNYPEMNTRYIENAICFTDAPDNLKTLFCQRRRWTNSLIFCNLMLLLNIPKYTIFKKIRMISILLLELWICLIMPLLMCLSYFFICIFIYNYNYNADNINITQTFIFLLFPTIMSLLLFNFHMVKYSFIFILFLPLYSIFIPLYSIYHSDDVGWGKTRSILS